MGQRVAAVLGLGERHATWLAQLEGELAVGPPLEPFQPDRLAGLLRRLGCSEAAVADTVGTVPTPEGDPERWWLLERSHNVLVATMGDMGADLGRWPPLPAGLGVAGNCFPLHLFAATVPAVRAWHAACGVPDDVSWATLADLGRHEAAQRHLSGATGVDAPWWMLLHLRGVLLEVGGLQYVPYRLGTGPEQPAPWYGASEGHLRGEGFRPGDLGLGLHIPARADISPAACRRSMAGARTLFDRLFPSPARRLLTCSSWLLDDQLSAYLPAGANIIGFQRLFELVPGWAEADEAVLGFVFGKRGVPVAPGPGLSRLQRAVLEHLASGGHFRWRTGWCELPQATP